MNDEPAGDEKSNGKQDGDNREQVFLHPPQRKEKAHAEGNTGDLARYNAETSEYKNGADERRSQVASWQCNGPPSADYVGDAAFVRVK